MLINPFQSNITDNNGMRHAIESAFDRAGYENGARFFGNSINPETGKVTNGEFIARMAKLYREGFDI